MSNTFQNWLNISAVIAKSTSNTPNVQCPNCGNTQIDHQYVGDSKTKIGYLDVWCPSCLQGIHISRVGIPDGASILPFDASDDEIRNRIPNYHQVTPTA